MEDRYRWGEIIRENREHICLFCFQNAGAATQAFHLNPAGQNNTIDK